MNERKVPRYDTPCLFNGCSDAVGDNGEPFCNDCWTRITEYAPVWVKGKEPWHLEVQVNTQDMFNTLKSGNWYAAIEYAADLCRRIVAVASKKGPKS